MRKRRLLAFLLVAGTVGLAVNNIKAPLFSTSTNAPNLVKVEEQNPARPILTPDRELVIPDGATHIYDKTTFLAYFNNSASNSAVNAYLSADIDLEGDTYALRMHGEYSAIFEGNGFTIKNFTETQSLFNIVAATGVVRNVTVKVTKSGSSFGGVAFQNNGSFLNVTTEIRLTAAVNSIGGMSQLGGGTFDNCQSNWIFETASASSNTIWRICSGESNDKVTNCRYSYTGGSEAIFSPGTPISNITLVDFPVSTEPSVEAEIVDNEVIYVEMTPHTAEVSFELLNSSDTPTWSLDTTTGIPTYATAEFSEEDDVVIVTAVALGNVSFKVKATVGEDSYVSALITIQVLNNDTDYVIPDNPIEIGTVAAFKSYFDSSAVNVGRNLLLTADLDLGGWLLPGGQSVGKGDTFTGIFEGQGHTVKGLIGKGLFNAISSASEIRNLNVELTLNGSGGGGIAYSNSGTIKNCTMKVTVTAAYNSWGSISMLASGKFINCRTDFIFRTGSAAANALYPVMQNDAGKDITNCTYTLIGLDGVSTSGKISTGHASVTRDTVREGALGFSLWIMDYTGGDELTPECSAKWDLAVAKWQALSAASQDALEEQAEFGDAWLRFNAWAFANGTTVAAISSGSGVATDTNRNDISTTLIIGVISISTIALYYFTRRRKITA